MAATSSTKIKEAFGVIIVGVVLVPIASSFAAAANLTGSTAAVVTILPVLLAVLIVLYVVGLF